MNQMDDGLRNAVLGLASAAQNRYNQFYDNALYARATAGYGGDYERCYALQDDAMALCGSPLHKVRYDLFKPPTAEEAAFLMAFVDGLRAEAKIVDLMAPFPSDEDDDWAGREAKDYSPEELACELLQFKINEYVSEQPQPAEDCSLSGIGMAYELAAACEELMSDADQVLVEIDFGVWLYYYGQKEN